MRLVPIFRGLRPGILLLAALILPAAMLRAEILSEDSIKAGFVLNFAKYAEWPSAAMGGGALKICGLGSDALAGKMAEFKGRQVHGREVQIRYVQRAEELRECHVLFIPAAEAQRTDQVLRTLAQAPTLTVSDTPDFVQSGGMIGLKQRAGRIRFDISLIAVRKVGLNLNSQLLRLADEVLQ